MYIIDDTYFQAPKREIANLNEADSRSFVELEQLIDEKCRLLLLSFLTVEQFTELDGFLTDGLFPEETEDIPQKWIDLVNGKTYEKDGISLIWNGLIYSKGTAKNSLLADYIYYHWLIDQASYMTGTGDSKANPKGAKSVNPTQRIVRVWNDFVGQYQYTCFFREVSLLKFLSDNDEIYPNENRELFTVQNQFGL